jgi:hypothetical protein
MLFLLMQLAYISFGFQWEVSDPIAKDVLIYNFSIALAYIADATFRSMDRSSWGTASPIPRYDHHLWYLNEKLILFGGRTTTQQLSDLWELNLATNKWQQITGTDNTIGNIFEATVIFVPNPPFYSLYLQGGVVLGSNSPNKNLYRYQSCMKN